jgi:serine protease Do
VYANNVRSVVAITCTVPGTYLGQAASGTSMGSGFILTPDGYIVTNHHVVEGATSVTVTANDGTNYTAAIVGSDSNNDIAVLKVEGNNLPAVAIGSSSELIVGDQVAAIGNALGELTNSLTVGYISAKDRMITTDGFGINMLQTDTAINSGNSGGPLFNMRGEVVGITTAKYSGESSSGASIEGIGFAIPIDDVLGMIEDLVNQGYIGGAYLGVSVSDVNAEVASYYGFPLGAYVQEAVPGGPAARAGIQTKDIIIELGGYEINGVTSLTRALRNFSAGDTTTVTVYRNGEKLQLKITLDEKPQS